MRGKAECHSCLRFVRRITPAYAGKRFEKQLKRKEYGDHPRLCGEKFPINVLIYIQKGSPPPMRGKESAYTPQSYPARITPAYAGKRVIRSGFHKLFQDHPRLCGEKATHLSVSAFVCKDHPRLCGEKQEFRAHVALPVGSPPPMRGKVPIPEFPLVTSRITPAYAGKSNICVKVVSPTRDHPRLCGEK